jgi:two-component system sensor histidine kinase KdpD
VFEKFFRGRGMCVSGVGLGLTVCRAIAVAHGGRIEAAARDGGGAVFRVWFPDDGEPPRLADSPELVARAS